MLKLKNSREDDDYQRAKKNFEAFKDSKRVDKSEFSKLKRDLAFREKKLINRLADDFENGITQSLFGNVSMKNRLSMSGLQVTDIIPFDDGDLSVYQLNRYRLENQSFDIPTLKECIDTNKSSHLEIRIAYEKVVNGKAAYAPLLDRFSHCQKLCDTINHYSLEVLEYDIATLEEDSAAGPQLEPYLDYLYSVREKIKGSEGSKAAYIRLGQGKMQFYQTIALAVFNKQGRMENDQEWMDYLLYCDGRLEGEVPPFYPQTRIMTRHKNMPLGWISLRFSDSSGKLA
jgi:hypothetical protein